MAVRLESRTKRFIGTSHDTKPTIADGDGNPIPFGSTFLEEDTGIIARYGVDGWVTAHLPVDETLPVTQMLYLELRRIREILELSVSG